MELYQLRTFAAVAEEGHLTHAAKRLFISQPAVSAHIKGLEEELGVKLFQRTPKGMVLTEAGNALKPKVDKALASIQDLKDLARALQGELVGKVRIGLNTDPQFLHLTEFLALLMSSHPHLEFKLIQDLSGMIVEAVRTGQLDAGFIYGEANSRAIKSVPLTTARLAVIAPPEWKERIADAEWEDLMELPWILTPPECSYRRTINGVFSRRGLNPEHVTEVDHEIMLTALVAAGGGLSMLRLDKALKAQEAGQLAVWDKETMHLELAFIHHRERSEDPQILAILQALNKVWNADRKES